MPTPDPGVRLSGRAVAVDLDPAYGWSTARRAGLTLHQVGHLGCTEALLEALAGDGEDRLERAAALLRREFSHFACIVEAPDFIFAAVDRVRSYPVFYAANAGRGAVSNSARSARRRLNPSVVNELGLREFQMAGYVTGGETLYRDLYQLQAGQCLCWGLAHATPQTRRYYRYVPCPLPGAEEEALIEELSSVVDRIIRRVIAFADGAPIWVPLSGGLDSRLILAKLAEFGVARLQSFSYGVAGNHDAATARRMAGRLNVPWFHVPPDPSRAMALFDSDMRRSYAALADGLCMNPSYLEYEAILKLVSEKTIPPDAVVVNGQSGDFIFGGHIPAKVLNNRSPNFSDLFTAVVDKHYSLWPKLNTLETLRAIERKFTSLLPDIPPQLSARDRACALYESWEWQERQVKIVVNGQRTYDFFGLRWCLPLWDGNLMDFCAKIPFDLKAGQTLHTRYLRRYNFKGVFQQLRGKPRVWSGRKRWVPWVARTSGLLFGDRAKERFYHRMYYYGTDHYQFALFGRDYYLAHYLEARGVVSFQVDHWLAENGFERPVAEPER